MLEVHCYIHEYNVECVSMRVHAKFVSMDG